MRLGTPNGSVGFIQGFPNELALDLASLDIRTSVYQTVLALFLGKAIPLEWVSNYLASARARWNDFLFSIIFTECL